MTASKRNRALLQAYLWTAAFGFLLLVSSLNRLPRTANEDSANYIKQARDTMFVLSHKN